MSLPDNGMCELQCVLIIQPNKENISFSKLEDTVIFTSRKCISLKSIKKKKNVLFPLTLKKEEKQCIAYLCLDIEHSPSLSVFQEPLLPAPTRDDTPLQFLKGMI
jgi:hypothetical protein